MSLLADMITKEFEGLMIEGESVLRNLQYDNVYDVDTLIAWRKKAGEFLTAWETFPALAKIECCPTPERTYKDRLELQVEIIAQAFNLTTKSTPECMAYKSIGANDPIDKILEERGRIHGDSNVSGEAFAKGIELLYEVGDKSNTITPYAFDGHMYAAMQCFIRLRHNPWHQDNYDDLLGYLRLAMKGIGFDERRNKC